MMKRVEKITILLLVCLSSSLQPSSATWSSRLQGLLLWPIKHLIANRAKAVRKIYQDPDLLNKTDWEVAGYPLKSKEILTSPEFWKDVAGLNAAIIISVLLWKTSPAAYRTTSALIQRLRLKPQQVSPEEHLKEKGEIAQKVLVGEDLLPRAVAGIVGSYLQREEYELYTTIQLPPEARRFTLNHNGTLATTFSNQEHVSIVTLWDIARGAPVQVFRDDNEDIDARNIFLSSYFNDNTIRVISTRRVDNSVTIKDLALEQESVPFNQAAGTTIVTFQALGAGGALNEIIRTNISGDGHTIGVVTQNNQIYIGKIPEQPTVEPIAYTTIWPAPFPFIKLNQSGTQAAILTLHLAVSLWNIEPVIKQREFTIIEAAPHADAINFNRSGTEIAIAGSTPSIGYPHVSVAGIPLGMPLEAAVYIFDVNSGKLQKKLAPSNFVIYNHDGDLIATVVRNDVQLHAVQLWNEAGTNLQTLSYAEEAVAYVRFSGDDTTLAAIDTNNLVHIWKTKHGQREMKAHEEAAAEHKGAS